MLYIIPIEIKSWISTFLVFVVRIFKMLDTMQSTHSEKQSCLFCMKENQSSQFSN